MLALARLVAVIDLPQTLMQISAQTSEEFCSFYCAYAQTNGYNADRLPS